MTAPETTPPPSSGGGTKRSVVLRALAWLGIGAAILLVLVYGRLLFGPISLNFLSDQVKGTVAGVVEDNYTVDWADFGISLTGPLSVGFHLAGVTLTERASDAAITMEALEIGLSPVGALMGRPDARVILVKPEIQMLQDLLGPRLARFAFEEDRATGETIVQIIEGAEAVPTVVIGDEGVLLDAEAGNGDDYALRSDNDWLVASVESLNFALAELADQAMAGQIRRVEIRDGSVGMLDTVYGLYKSFHAVDLEVRSGREDGRVSALFSAQIAGRTMDGTIVRQIEGEGAVIEADVHNIDFSTVIPFLDDADGLAALRGAGRLNLEIAFDTASGRVTTGHFEADISGMNLRLNHDLFPVRTAPFRIDWYPDDARFSLTEVEIAIGQSRAILVGDIVMGFDADFGPTLGMSIRARDVWLHPDDMDAPAEPFDELHFEGWSAPLYGALGIDRMVVAREGASVVMQGRIDMVREGVGLNVALSGRGASADDVKRLWPYLFAPEGREWFIGYVEDGTVRAADMRFDFPVGTLDMDGGEGPVPDGSMSIDLVGSGIQLTPFEGLPEFEVDGDARLTIRDNQLTMAFERALLPEFGDGIVIEHAAYLNQDMSVPEQIFEISGDVSGSVDSILRVANSEALNLLEDIQFGVDLDALAEDIAGEVAATVIATIMLDETGEMAGADYALNGTIRNMRGTEPLQGLAFTDAGFAFTASQAGFRVLGSANVAGVEVDMQAIKSGDGAPDIRLASTLAVADAAEFGIDLSDYMSGSVRVVAQPLDEGRFEVSADLTDAAITVGDLGISKARGASGGVRAVVTIDEDGIAVSGLDLGFGTVRLAGDIALGADGELESAEFSTFRLSAGDNARLSLTPVSGGYAVAISGAQLDLKPVLRQVFDLEGGQRADAGDRILNARVNLDRALGYYGEAAFNLDLDLSLRGSDLARVNLTTQFGGNRSASATTNQQPSGRVITYATNDLGATMRFVGVYPRIVNGEASLVLRNDADARADAGEFIVRNFAVADEDNLDAIIGTHEQSRAVVGGATAIDFDYGRAQFVMYRDRVEIIEAAVYGNQVGGTVRGNIFTQAGQYDLAGTYVPLFGLNNFFQQIPILGPIFGGREGEGLIGVTFAVRGPLNDPQLLVNPVSILAPGVFRTLFEYRAANQSGTR